MNRSLLHGFTLLELLLVVAIIMILGTSSAIFYGRFLNQSNVNLATDQIAGQLRKAQMYSISGRENTTWGVRYASNRITLFATASSAFDQSFDVSAAISVTNFTTVTFAKNTGIPNVTPTITVSGNGTTKQISVNSMGVVNK